MFTSFTGRSGHGRAEIGCARGTYPLTLLGVGVDFVGLSVEIISSGSMARCGHLLLFSGDGLALGASSSLLSLGGAPIGLELADFRQISVVLGNLAMFVLPDLATPFGDDESKDHDDHGDDDGNDDDFHDWVLPRAERRETGTLVLLSVIGMLPTMRAFRRGLIVVGVAAVAGALMKVRGKGGVPPTNGGWRELEAPDFR